MRDALLEELLQVAVLHVLDQHAQRLALAAQRQHAHDVDVAEPRHDPNLLHELLPAAANLRSTHSVSSRLFVGVPVRPSARLSGTSSSVQPFVQRSVRPSVSVSFLCRQVSDGFSLICQKVDKGPID